jgi:hypothetical protein
LEVSSFNPKTSTEENGRAVWPIRRIAGSGSLQKTDLISSQRQEISMSGINGDKARFNRRRRQKISRRQSNEKMLKALAEKNLVAPAKAANLKEKVA